MSIFPGSLVASFRIRSMRSSRASAVPHWVSTCALRLPVDGASPALAAPVDTVDPLASVEPLAGAAVLVGVGGCTRGVCGASPVGDTGGGDVAGAPLGDDCGVPVWATGLPSGWLIVAV